MVQHGGSANRAFGLSSRTYGISCVDAVGSKSRCAVERWRGLHLFNDQQAKAARCTPACAGSSNLPSAPATLAAVDTYGMR